MREHDRALHQTLFEQYGPMIIEAFGNFPAHRCDFCANEVSHFLLKAIRQQQTEIWACLECKVAELSVGREKYRQLLFDACLQGGTLNTYTEISKARRRHVEGLMPTADATDYVKFEF